MPVCVRFFSQLKEIVGDSERVVEMAAGSSVADLLAELYRLHPGLERWDRQLLIGAGVEFVGREHVLQSTDEIALMPPVQGG